MAFKIITAHSIAALSSGAVLYALRKLGIFLQYTHSAAQFLLPSELSINLMKGRYGLYYIVIGEKYDKQRDFQAH